MAGKGSSPRKVNIKSYDENYDLIFSKKKVESVSKKQTEQQEKDFAELILQSIKLKQNINEN